MQVVAASMHWALLLEGLEEAEGVGLPVVAEGVGLPVAHGLWMRPLQLLPAIARHDAATL